jgi:hypothetical protein
MKKKTIPISSVSERLIDIRRQIADLRANEKMLLDMLADTGNGSSPKTRKKRENSGFRRAITVLEKYPDGLTVSQLVEKAKENGIEIQSGTLTSQLSKATKSEEVRRKEDGRYVAL